MRYVITATYDVHVSVVYPADTLKSTDIRHLQVPNDFLRLTLTALLIFPSMHSRHLRRKQNRKRPLPDRSREQIFELSNKAEKGRKEK